jgi:CO/xanthine dehydrogenase Mo-binding subunit
VRGTVTSDGNRRRFVGTAAIAQVAADELELPLENITIKLGDSSLPQSPVEGGSWIAGSVPNGIATAAAAIRGELLGQAKARVLTGVGAVTRSWMRAYLRV